jgi:hypothetical protein
MSSSPVLHENMGRKEEERKPTPPGVKLIVGVLWMVAAAGAWILILVGFHNLMARLLS